MTPKEHKAAIRKRKLLLRNLLSPEQHHTKSAALAIRGEKSIPFKLGMKIATFYPIHSEANVRLLTHKIKEKGFLFCLPTIEKGILVFRQYNTEDMLVKTDFGILGPPPNSPMVDPELIFVPLIAFDSYGNRIGYGRGYYDTAMARARLQGKDPYLVGIAFDLQETSYIMADSTDIRLHAILTESRFKQFSKSIVGNT
ncbi:5-formyltetrahydrofolate cyclo-ligase [Candidatus Liberibacter sp.]|uniref:5-formyltetrahydrofolate cyclo-ligase n=1 Tax=Candidatus Liberibacter sp. TaxID=34022 RepID=UPI0015F3D7AE|nr:5-formyltetrahydrofolate cyclo-ligase [Candidatus Liberibacter sp.]MBA5723646.1 5-formyltetrahydrofolate cyclo-ligase [Candidatus Liberibacter sp.]